MFLIEIDFCLGLIIFLSRQKYHLMALKEDCNQKIW